MTVLFDTNVVLDVLLEREPHVGDASKLFAQADTGRIRGLICATTATTICYIAAKHIGVRKTRALLRELLDLFAVAAVNGAVLDAALDLDIPDYEDAVLHEAARAAGADAIVTRDRGGFSRATIPVLAPRELLAAMAATGQDR